MPNVDWKKIKSEYITTNISQRELAKKYGVGARQLAEKSKQDNWVDQRKQNRSKTAAKTIEKISEKEANNNANNLMRVINISSKILDKLEKKVDQMDEMDEKAYRTIAATVKDLKDVMSVKTEAELREQEARIDKLRAEINKDNEEAKAVSVVFKGVDDSWLK